jgi:C-methyltransferase
MSAGSRELTPPAIFDMMRAYKVTALLNTALELGVFDRLSRGGADAEAVARDLRIDPRGARLLLNGLAALGLLESDGTTYGLGAGGERHLVRGRPGFVGDMNRVIASEWEWEAMRRLPEAVRRGGPVVGQHAETPGYAYWEDFAAHAAAVADPTARRAADALGPWASERPTLDILDMACGHGIYGFTLVRRHPCARVWSLDWPNVLPFTRAHAQRMGVAERFSTIPGDMFEVPLGGPYDVVMITNVLHHFSEARGIELLRRAAAAMTGDGRIVLVGFTVADRPPASDPEPHLFSVLMLTWTFQGEVHSVSAYERMLVAAGFGDAEVHDVPSLPLRIIVGARL